MGLEQSFPPILDERFQESYPRKVSPDASIPPDQRSENHSTSLAAFVDHNFVPDNQHASPNGLGSVLNTATIRDEDTEIQIRIAMEDELPNQFRHPTISSPKSSYSPPAFECARDIDGEMEANYEDGWTILEDENAPNQLGVIDFLREFHGINERRQDATLERLKVKEQKNRMKIKITQLLDAAAVFVKQQLDLKDLQKGEQDLNLQLEVLQQALDVFRSEEQIHDSLEENLIQVEYDLQQSEEQLYKQILGDRSQPGDNDYNSAVVFSTAPHLSTSQTHVPKQYAATAEDKLMTLKQQNHQLKAKLEHMETEFKSLSTEAANRAIVGVSLDKDSQDFLNIYPRQRSQLWKEMTILDDQIRSLDQILADHTKLFYGPNQFSEAQYGLEELKVRIRQAEDEPLLQSFQEYTSDRSIELQPILELQTHDQQRPLFTSSTTQVSKASISVLVSAWLLEGLESSFRSFMQYFFWGGLDASGFDYTKVRKLLPRSWFVDSRNSLMYHELSRAVASVASTSMNSVPTDTLRTLDVPSTPQRLFSDSSLRRRSLSSLNRRLLVSVTPRKRPRSQA